MKTTTCMFCQREVDPKEGFANAHKACLDRALIKERPQIKRRFGR